MRGYDGMDGIVIDVLFYIIGTVCSLIGKPQLSVLPQHCSIYPQYISTPVTHQPYKILWVQNKKRKAPLFEFE
jgi:hypothetical protein